MENQQTINKELIEYVKQNAISIIENLVRLYEYQENITIKYKIKKKK